MIEAIFFPEQMLWWHWGLMALPFLGIVLWAGWQLYLIEADIPSIEERVEVSLRKILSEKEGWKSKGRMVRYRTKYGDLQVRLKSVHSAHEDIAKWLKDNGLYSDKDKYKIRISGDDEYGKDI